MKLNLSKRQKRKFKKLLATCVAFAALATASGQVQAEPVTGSIATALMYFVGYDTAIAIAAAVVSFAASSALSYAVGAITKPSAGGYSSNALADRTHMVRSSVAARTIVYGRSMVSGPLAFIATTNRGDGPNGVGGTTIKGGENAFLHLVVLLANHEIDAVEEVYLGDEPIGFATMSGNKPVGGKFGGVISQGEPVTTTFTVPANSTSITLGGLGATSILGLAEVGATSASMPSGGEGGVDAFGNPILPNGGTASVDTAFTFVNATTVTTPAVNRSRNMAMTYISKGVAASYVDCYANLGSPSQSANAALMASCPDKWTAAHRLQGVAYLYLRLLYNAKAFPNGIPNVKALIRGKKVRDPRNPSYPNDTPTWTPNYALCVADYLKSPDGLGCTDSDLDLDDIKISANVCDEIVTIRPGAVGVQGVGVLPVTQKRYETHGVVLLDHDVEDNLRGLSTAGGGPVPVLVNGKFKVPVGWYGTPIATPLTQSDLRAAVKVRPRTPRRSLFNSVGGTYVDGRINWQPTDFPEVTNALYQSQDAGEKIKRDITLAFTTDEIMAQRLAKIMLERSRQGIVIEWPGKPSCFRVQTNDLVPVTLSKFGWTNKAFRVISWNMASNGAVDLVLQEDAAGVYDWNYGQATTTDLSKDTNLPDPSYVTPMGALTCYSDSSELVRTGDGTIVSRMHVLWPATTDGSIISGGHFEVQYKTAAETFWTPWDNPAGAASETWIFPVIDTETYFVRVRAVNNRDIPTDWVYAKHKIIGNTAPPPNVANFAVTVRADGTRSFSWTTNNQPVNVTTGGGYRIRYRNSALNTAWADMAPLHNGLLSQSPLQVADPVAGSYDFAIVAVNASRVESTPAFVNDAVIGQEPVTYGATANMLLNSDWQLSNGLSTGGASLYGWTFQNSSLGVPTSVGRHSTTGHNPGRGGAFIYDLGAGAGTTQEHHIEQKVSGLIVGRFYEFSVLFGAQRCKVGMDVIWLDGNGSQTGNTTQQVFDMGAGAMDTTSGIGAMRQLWDRVEAPAQTSQAIIRLFKYATTGGQADSWAFFNRAMFCLAPANASRQTPSPWIEAGMDQLHGGSLTDLSVNSAQIGAEAATALRYAAGGESGRWVDTAAVGQTMTNLGGTSFTAPVDCTVTVFFEVNLYSEPTGYSGGGAIIVRDTFIQLSNSLNYSGDAANRIEIAIPGSRPQIISGSRSFTLSAGQYREYYVCGIGSGTAFWMHSASATIRLEVVKK